MRIIFVCMMTQTKKRADDDDGEDEEEKRTLDSSDYFYTRQEARNSSSRHEFRVQGSAKMWSLGCVNSRLVARASQETGFTQPRAHFLSDPCL